MSVFPIIKTEDKVQVGDKIRIWADQTFSSPDAGDITKVEIKADTAETFVDVYDADKSQWFFDWAYSTAGTKTVSLRVTTTLAMVDTLTTVTKSVECVTAAADNLFSNDQDLKTREHDILRWLPDGFSSWNHIHRQAQQNILDWLDEIRLFKNDGTRWEASDLVEKEQVRRISVYTTLRLIFESLSNQVDDVFATKARGYYSMEKEAKNRNYLSLDLNGDGEITSNEKADMRTFRMVRR